MKKRMYEKKTRMNSFSVLLNVFRGGRNSVHRTVTKWEKFLNENVL